MSDYARGSVATLTARFTAAGVLVDVVDPTVTITSPSSTTVVSAAAGTRVTVGTYRYDWSVPLDAELGAYDVTWTATLNGATVVGSETIDVVDVGAVGFDPYAPVPLATPDQLGAWLGFELTEGTLEHTRATLLLDAASAAVRRAGRQQFSRTVDDVVTLRGTAGDVLYLPQLPVQHVDRVELESGDGWYEVDPATYRLGPAGQLRAVHGWRSAGHRGLGTWSADLDRDQLVRVTYTHGYDPVPADVVGIVLALAGRVWVNPASLSTEQLDGYLVVFGSATSSRGAFSLAREERDLLRKLTPTLAASASRP